MAIEFVKTGNAWVAVKDGVTLTVNDADGDNKIENHDGFKVTGGSISVFGKSSEIVAAIAKLVPSGYTQATLDYYKTDENGNHRFDDVTVKTTDKGKVLTIKQGTEYNVGSLFNAVPPKTTSNSNANASTGTTNTGFSQFDTSSIMSGFGGGFGGGSAFTFNPSAVPGMNFMASNAAAALAGYCTSPIDSISATSFGAALPGWFTRFFVDPTTAYGINNTQSMPFLTAAAFAKKWSGPIDLRKPIESSSSTSTTTTEQTTTPSTTATDEVTFDDGTTPIADAGDKTGAKKVTIVKTTQNYDGKGSIRTDYSDGSALTKYADGSYEKLHTDKDGNRICEKYTANNEMTIRITYPKGGGDKKIETFDTKAQKAAKAETKKKAETEEEKAGKIAQEFYAALKGVGGNNEDIVTAAKQVNQYNVIEVLEKWNKLYSNDMNGETLIESINNDTGAGGERNKSLQYIRKALVERAKSMGLTDEAEAFEAKAKKEMYSWWTNENSLERMFKEIYDQIIAKRDEKAE